MFIYVSINQISFTLVTHLVIITIYLILYFIDVTVQIIINNY